MVLVDGLLAESVQPHDKRCLGWLCNWRDRCARHMEENEVVIRQWFLPVHVAEFCEHFVEHAPDGRDAGQG
jgi:hypothetical protein